MIMQLGNFSEIATRQFLVVTGSFDFACPFQFDSNYSFISYEIYVDLKLLINRYREVVHKVESIVYK